MNSLRGRLGVALGVTAFVAVGVTALLSIGLLRRYAEENARADLTKIARAIADQDPELLGNQSVLRLAAVKRLLDVNGDQAALVFAGGAVAGDAAEIARGVDVSMLASGTSISGTVRASSGEYVYAGVPVSLARRRAVTGVFLARPVTVARGLLGPLVARVTLAAIVAVVIALAISVALARRMTKPLHDVSEAASRIAHGDLSQRVPVTGDDELARLGTAFNDMAAALSESQRREREFIASVSHELRTPITAIRGYAEAIEDGAVRDERGRVEAVAVIHSEADRLERMVKDVMDLARVGSPEFHLEPADVDLAETLERAVAAHQGEAVNAGVTLDANVPDRLPAHTDADRVRQVVSNLVQNALRVTPAGGRVGVIAREEGSSIRIDVSDTGPGIARADLPHVFERSYLWRASKGSRPVGTGLGLAIVRELVTMLGGRVTVDSEEGRGSVFHIELPRHA